jgi:pilus assembly protein Flp/PilA
MHDIIKIAERFRREEDGASLIEYSVLIGIILVLSIATIIFVGNWVSAQWTELESELQETEFQPPD